MNALVRCQSSPVGKALPAAAGMAAFLCMGVNVSVEDAGIAEVQITVRTFVRLFGLVSVQAVSPEMPHQR